MANTIKQIARREGLDEGELIKLASRLLGGKRGRNKPLTASEERILLDVLDDDPPEPEDEDPEQPEDEEPSGQFLFLDDTVSREVHQREALPHAVYCHDEVIGALDRHAGDNIGRRISLVMRHLVAHGRTSVVKGTRGNENRGWRRSPLGGNGGMQFYVWWTVQGTPPAAGLKGSEGSIYVRAVRHHDDHRPLDAGELRDFLPVKVADLDRPEDIFPDPWTPEQRAFARQTDAVRVLCGYPGSGKTTSLWCAVDLRAGERVLYLTWSRALTVLAQEHFDAFAPQDTTVEALAYGDIVDRILGASEEAAGGEGTIRDTEEAFLGAAGMLPPRLLGPWNGHLRSLLAEIRAQLVGAALPDAPADLHDPGSPRLSDDAYLGRRRAELGEEAAKAVLAVTAALENGGHIERFFPELSRAFSAGRGLGPGIELPPGLDRLDRIVVDEVQDLTPVEALVPVLLAKRLAESREDLRMPFLLFAGDEGQTVRATGFEWGWFKDILTSRLGHRPAEATLTANMRCPRRIAGVVNAARDLYDSVNKGTRPRGLAAVEVDDATNDRIFLCQAGPDDAAGTLITQLADQPNLTIICLDDEAPAYVPDGVRNAVLTPEDVKGQDFQQVCILDPGRQIERVYKDDEDLRRDRKVVPLWKRTAADRTRVALSRATETLIFLDIDPDAPGRQRSEAFLGPFEAVPVGAGELVEYLSDDDPEERVRACIRDAEAHADRRPDLAWRRAVQAIRLLGDPAKPGAVQDRELRREAHLTCARVAATITVEALPGELKESTVLAAGAKAAAEAGREDITKLLKLLATRKRPQHDLSLAEVKAREQAIRSLKRKDAWLTAALRPRCARWRTALDARLGELTPEAMRELRTLPRMYEALMVPEAASEARKTALRLVETLVDRACYPEARKVLDSMDAPPPDLDGRCWEGLGKLDAAAACFERALSWEDALRCHRALADLDGALRCLAQLDGHPDTPAVTWLTQVRDTMAARPGEAALTEAERAWLETQVSTALGGGDKQDKVSTKTKGASTSRPKTGAQRGRKPR